MYKIAIKRLRNIHDAQDAVQDTYMIAFKKLKSLKDNKKFKPWLNKILVNRCNAIYNKQSNKIELMDEIPSKDESMNDINDKIDFGRILQPLNKEDQKIFELRFQDRLSIKQIANVLNINENTVKTKLNRGRKKLGHSLRPATILLILCFFIATSVIATCIISYIKGLFETKTVGIHNEGISSAIENLDWFQKTNMDYIDLGNGYSLSIEYILMDEMNLYLVIDFQSEEDINKFTDIALPDLYITNENEDIICNKNDMFAKQYVKKIGDKLIEKDNHHMRSLIYMYTNSFPISNTLNINFSRIVLSKKSIISNNDYLHINTNVNFTVELDEKFINRNSISYISSNKDIEKAIITETGFYAIMELPNFNKSPEIILIDESGISYNCYISVLTHFDTSYNTKYFIVSTLNNNNISKNLKLLINNNEYNLIKK